MTKLTLEIPAHLERRLLEEAARTQQKPETLVLSVLEKQFSLESPLDLSFLVGSMTAEELREFEVFTADTRKVEAQDA